MMVAKGPKNRMFKLPMHGKAGLRRQLDERAAREDLSALKAMWAFSDPEIRATCCKVGSGWYGASDASRIFWVGRRKLSGPA
jgi:hypothetical protein